MKLWGGRFEKATDDRMQVFNASILFDQRLYDQDITGSIAWARELARSGILSADEGDEIVAGLEAVRAEFAAGRFEFQPADEDIHTAVERRLTELIGPTAGKLHTGRSRNDQVATDLRLYLRQACDQLGQALHALQTAIVVQAETHHEVIMPGYTHLQPAQPVLFSHWLLAYFWKFERDRQRLAQLAERGAVLPLGAGALAGTPLAIDRDRLAAELGFPTVAQNSMDAVADRDAVVELLAWAALLQVHLSSLAEDLVIWSSREFGFVTLDDAYSTGSSLMPQKKNPDSLELVRGKSGRLIGNLTGLLVTLKGLPSTYNKDLQEDKEPLFDTLDTLSLELPIVAGVIRTLTVYKERMAAALDAAMLATDLADYLVKKGIPFRETHHLAGQAVRQAEVLGVPLDALPLDALQAIHPAFGADVTAVFDWQQSVSARAAAGGTAPQALQVQLEQARQALEPGSAS